MFSKYTLSLITSDEKKAILTTIKQYSKENSAEKVLTFLASMKEPLKTKGVQVTFKAAVFHGHLNLAEQIKDSYLHVLNDADYSAALIIACRRGHLNIVQLIAKKFMSLDISFQIWSSLVLSVSKKGHLPIFEYLCDKTLFNFTLADHHEFTISLLEKSIQHDQPGILKSLIEKLIQADEGGQLVELDADTKHLINVAFLKACKFGKYDTVVYLCSLNMLEPDLNQKDKKKTIPIVDPNFTNRLLYNAMHFALQTLNIDLIQFLLSKKVEIRPLYFTSSHAIGGVAQDVLELACQKGNFKFIQFILELNAPALRYFNAVNLVNNAENIKSKRFNAKAKKEKIQNYVKKHFRFQEQQCLNACMAGDLSKAREEYKEGMDLSQSYNHVLVHVCSQGYLDIVKFLILEVKINYTAVDCRAALEAVKGGHIELVEFLIEKQVLTPNRYKDALECAITYGKIEVIKLLKARFFEGFSFDLDFLDFPIHAAFAQQRFKVICYLLENEALSFETISMICKYSMIFGDSNFLNYLLNLPVIDYNVYANAFKKGYIETSQVEMLRCFDEHLANEHDSVTINAAFAHAARTEQLDVLTYLKTHRAFINGSTSNTVSEIDSMSSYDRQTQSASNLFFADPPVRLLSSSSPSCDNSSSDNDENVSLNSA